MTETPAPITESQWWSFFKACVTGFAMGLTVTGILSGEPFLEAIVGMVFHHIPVAVAMVTLAPVLSFPVRFLADLAQKLAIPRGLSDVLIGVICGALMMVPEVMSGRPPSIMSLGFLVGGGFGGFVFWRGRGYPDAALLRDMGDALIGRFHAG
jgi:hypothetical protein